MFNMTGCLFMCSILSSCLVLSLLSVQQSLLIPSPPTLVPRVVVQMVSVYMYSSVPVS